MLNLLRSDLYRTIRSPFFWVITAILIAVAIAAAALMSWISSPEFAQMVNSAITEEDLAAMAPEERAEVMADLESATSELEPLNGKVLDSLTSTWASMFLDGGLLGLMGSLFVVIFLLADFKGGFVKNLPMGRTGRIAYYAERIVFIALVQAFFLLACTAATTLSYAAFGFSYEQADSAGGIALWLLLAWLVAVAYALIVACLSWAVRSEALSTVAAVAVSTGMVGAFLTQALLYFGRVVPMLAIVPQWLPVSAISDLRHGAAGLAALDPGYALAGAPVSVHAAVVTLVVIVIMCAIILAACRRKDVA